MMAGGFIYLRNEKVMNDIVICVPFLDDILLFRTE